MLTDMILGKACNMLATTVYKVCGFEFEWVNISVFQQSRRLFHLLEWLKKNCSLLRSIGFTPSCWPSLIRHSSQCWLDAFPKPKMESVNIDISCVSWEVKGHHRLPKQSSMQEKEVKQTERFVSLGQNTGVKSRVPESTSFPNHHTISIHLILSSSGRSGEKSGAMRSIIYTNPSSATPWFALCSRDSQQPEASWHILKRPTKNDEIWRLVPLYGQWMASNLSHLSTTVSLFASCRVSQCFQTIPIGWLIKHSMNSMHCNVSGRFMPYHGHISHFAHRLPLSLLTNWNSLQHVLLGGN